MAALVAGVQYGLSSHNNFHENKSLIFVKLTDSAQRAIEDYLRNRGKINQNPTIQFLGNEGKLSFPSTKSNHGNFTFSLSSNQDIEGPQGGFECVQQIGPKNLQSLGTLPCKMRIQANDDVYETTRHRMHAAEENNKNKCTRVIKANEPIGRKVKVKGTVKSIPLSTSTSANAMPKHREPSHVNSANQSSKLTPSQKTVSNHLATTNRLQNDSQKKLTDVMRRPLKERLIHLLALRPFKRPELYDRITREGIREKEKNVIATVLKQIAFMRDNTYHLHRCVWNDVQEDWPFYTEQEKAMLKRRKPQNLTPPGSSDGGSSGSGQSPNSTHPGSPPTIAAPPPTLLAPKRPGYYQGNDGLPTKRQRISHYRKPESTTTLNTDNTKSNVSSINNCLDQKQQRSQRYQNQHQTQALQQQPNNYVATKSDMSLTNDSDDVTTKTVNKMTKPTDIPLTNSTSHTMHKQSDQYLQQPEKHSNHNLQKDSINSAHDIKNIEDENSDTSLIEFDTINVGNINCPAKISTETKSPNVQDNKYKETEQYTESEMNLPFESSSGAKSLNNIANSTVEDNFLSFSASSCNRLSHVTSESGQNTENPDYLTCYTTINNAEQRTRYKMEFNSDYKEYRKLHVQVVKISKQFSQLEEELKKKLSSGNIEGYEAIKHQILQEYAKTKSVNARFYYLHDKLGHIKKLVSDYDAQMNATSVTNTTSDQTSSSNVSSNSSHRDALDTRCDVINLPTKRPITCIAQVPHIS